MTQKRNVVLYLDSELVKKTRAGADRLEREELASDAGETFYFDFIHA